MEIYTVKDEKAGTCNAPFTQPSDVHALRAFKTEVNRAHEANMMFLYPAEFTLCHIGTFNEKEGALDSSTAKGPLANGAAVKAPN